MPAAALYTSALFRKSLLASLDTSRKTYILSAKHGMLSCDDVIDPYDVTLKTLPRSERATWGASTGEQLAAALPRNPTAMMYCGEEYVSPLRERLMAHPALVEEPLVGLSMGQRLQALAAINGERRLRGDVLRFYRLMHWLWLAQDGGRTLSECTGKLAWPRRGVYFFFELLGGISRGMMPRIVRVGTHAVSTGSQTTLWHRLSTHKGTSLGQGSHRSSIFRSHVGQAIMARDRDETWPTTWGKGQTAPREVRDLEAGLEATVSSTIGRMRVLWVDVPDEAGTASDRAYIERNAIGLLSRANLLSPLADEDWLGRYSPSWRISVSGLWNLNHVFTPPDEAFLDRLSEYLAAMGAPPSVLGGGPTPVTATFQSNLFPEDRHGIER